MAEKPKQLPSWVPDPTQAAYYTQPPVALINNGFNEKEAPDPGVFNYQFHQFFRWISFLDQDKVSKASVDVTKEFVFTEVSKARGYTDEQLQLLRDESTFKSARIDVNASNIVNFKTVDQLGRDISDETGLNKQSFIDRFFISRTQFIRINLNSSTVFCEFDWKTQDDLPLIMENEFTDFSGLAAYFEIEISGKSPFSLTDPVVVDRQSTTLFFPPESGFNYYIRSVSPGGGREVFSNLYPRYANVPCFITFIINEGEYVLKMKFMSPQVGYSTVNEPIKPLAYRALFFFDNFAFKQYLKRDV